MGTDRWYALTKLERVEDSPDFWRRRRWIVEQPLLIVSAGDGNRVVIDGDPVSDCRELVWACSPGQWAEVNSSPDREGSLYLLHYRTGLALGDGGHEADGGDSGEAAGGEAQRDGRPSFPNGALYVAEAAALCEKMSRQQRERTNAGRMRLQASFHELLAHLLADRDTVLALEKAVREMETRYAEDLTIERLAATAGMSRYHFMRSFKERIGLSAMQYLTKVRLREAKRLMWRPEPGSMLAIAAQTGFRNEHYFRITFSKQVGISPAVYIRNRKRKVAAYSWPVIGQLLPLQIVPYAAPIDHYWTRHFYSKYRDDVIVPLSHDFDFNRDALRRDPPDCIIGLDTVLRDSEEERLREIAPVLLIPWEDADWRRHLRIVGEYLDRRREAERWLEQYERKAEAWKERLGRAFAGERVLALKVAGDAICVWGRRAASVLFDDLGLPPAREDDGSLWYEETSPEELAAFGADRIVVIADRDARSRRTWEALQAAESWQALEAVRRGAVRELAGYEQWVHPWLENTAFNHERFLAAAAESLLWPNG